MVCVKTGGAVVESEADARALSELPELDGQEISEGKEISVPPCLPDHYLAEIQRQKGRPCPRPGMSIDPDNEVPLELMHVSLGEHTRHLYEGLLRDLVPRSERPLVRRRVASALRDPVVIERLYPKTDDEK